MSAPRTLSPAEWLLSDHVTNALQRFKAEDEAAEQFASRAILLVQLISSYPDSDDPAMQQAIRAAREIVKGGDA